MKRDCGLLKPERIWLHVSGWKFPVGKTGPEEAYKAVREYRDRYPEKAVTFYSQQYPQYGWAILMAGGSLPNVKISNDQLLKDLTQMKPLEGKNSKILSNDKLGYLIYQTKGDSSVNVAPGKYDIYVVDEKNGDVKISMKSAKISSVYAPKHKIEWLQKK